MEENKKKTIKLTTLIIGFVVILLILTRVIGGIIYKDKKTEKENIVEQKQEIRDADVSSTDFSLKFLKLENNKKNMLYSPLSIEYALNMLKEGADNNTYDEINNLIGNRKLPKYENIDKTMSLANGLFIRDRFYTEVGKEYINTLTNKYNAEVVKDKFENANNANRWIENKTLGIIKNMLQDNVVQNPNSVMLIINALAIDMEWNAKFDCNKTYGETFYLDNGKEIKATMMSKKEVKTDDVSYYKDNKITALTMDLKDYNGTQFEFMAIMPKDNLSKYVDDLSIEKINEIDKKLKSAKNEKNGVNVKVPKFKFNYSLTLKKDLINLGVKDAFDSEAADFTKMLNKGDTEHQLYVSDALHKADIEFTEKGVKAAAVTVITMMDTAAIREEKNPVDITINKPFVFVIRDKKTKDIWFVGTVYEPNLWENEKDSYTARY